MKFFQAFAELANLVFRASPGVNKVTIQPPATPAADRILNLPDASDTLVGKATTDSLTNKTFGDAATFAQISTPSSPASGFDKLYAKSNDVLYRLNSAGLEIPLSGHVYEEKSVLGSPASSSDTLTLPVDSRNGGAAASYIVGLGNLQVWLNGEKLFLGDDYNEIGTAGSTSNTITTLQNLVIGDKLVYRIVL